MDVLEKPVKIERVERLDAKAVIELVASVSRLAILPYFSAEGRETLLSKVLPDIETTFDVSRFQSFKVTNDDHEIVGFGAIRDHNYITHLFVDPPFQGRGLGQLILRHLLPKTGQDEVRLKSSINAVDFYESQGFVATGSEQVFNGIRFVPMIWLRQ